MRASWPNDGYLRNPFLLSPFQSVPDALPVKIGHRGIQFRAVNTLEGIDVHHGIHFSLDGAGHEWHGSTFSANMEFSRLRTKRILMGQILVRDLNRQLPVRM